VLFNTPIRYGVVVIAQAPGIHATGAFGKQTVVIFFGSYWLSHQPNQFQKRIVFTRQRVCLVRAVARTGFDYVLIEVNRPHTAPGPFHALGVGFGVVAADVTVPGNLNPMNTVLA
jgi:hypothetical protein